MCSATLVLLWSEHVPGLPTDLKDTPHIGLVRVAINTTAAGGEDAEEPHTSKRLSLFRLYHNNNVTRTETRIHAW